jgi:hypothetical protein
MAQILQARMLPHLDPRAANIAAKIGALITAVVESGTNTASPTSKNSERLSLELGVSSACHCLDYDPTATSTLTNTAPVAVSWLGGQ